MDITINSVAELSIEQLTELEKKEKIDRIIVKGIENFDTELTVQEYKRIYQKLQELTEGIKEEWSKTKKFVLIYKRISENLEYDYIAGYPKKRSHHQQEYYKRQLKNSRNLKNGLLMGKCVCAGYAEILRNTCLLKGVPSIVLVGPSKGGLHAWNQVQLDDGKWIEVDPTWDHSTGTKYMGTNKIKFWESHGIDPDSGKIIDSNAQITDEFKLTRFINDEFGLNLQYSTGEQKKFIDLLEKRDVQGLDISTKLDVLVEKVKLNMKFKRDHFERINKLREFEAEIEFEKECGYTVEQLKKIGFDETEIRKMKNKFDTQTGIKVNRFDIVNKSVIEKKEENKLKSGKRIQRENKPESVVSQEEKVKLRDSAEGLHPDILPVLIDEIERGYISLKDAYSIIKYRKGEESRDVVEKIKEKSNIIKAEKFKEQIEEFNKEFEEEIGYTEEELKKLGLAEEEINKIKHNKFDKNTGERIDRKKMVEKSIKKQKLKLTFQKIGQTTKKWFVDNPKEATDAINALENGVKTKEVIKEEYIEGEK